MIQPLVRLQFGMTYEQAMPIFNDDMEKLASSFQGFATEDVLAFPDNAIGPLNLNAGQIGIASAPVIAGRQLAEVVTMFPRLSVYVDPPTAGPGGFSVDYLFPTGAALTSGQKSLLLTQYRPVTTTADTSYSFTGSNGELYWYVGNVIFGLRNTDSAAHSYVFVLNQSVYSRDSNTFR